MPVFIFFSFLLSVVIIPLVIYFCRRNGWYDFVDERKVHSGNIPRLGSIGFCFAFIITTVCYFMIYTRSYNNWVALSVAGFIIFIFGIVDDFKNLPAKIKLLVQILVAIILIMNGYRITQIGSWFLGWLSWPVTFFWFIGIINAFNLIDGVDALCGGISFLVLITLGVVFIASQKIDSAFLCFSLAASVAGFLVYNKPKAKIFMGDGGSQFLGLMIAALALNFTRPAFEYNKFLAAALLVSVPAFDTIAAIWRRTREHRSFFSPDKAHLHHKLMNMGYSTIDILLLIYILQTGICVVALLALWTGGIKGELILIAGLCAVCLFYTVIHYTNRAVNRKNHAAK